MIRWIVVYVAIITGIVFAYSPVKELMIRQDAWVKVVQSTLSVNLFVFLFMWGVVSDRLTKRMPRKKSWAVWAIGLVVILGALRAGGLPMIFG